MKNLFTFCVFTFLLASCGGGGGSSTPASNTQQQAYGFNSEGGPYASTLDVSRLSYKYNAINLGDAQLPTGETSVLLTAQNNNTGVYSINGHDQHALAIDAGKNLMLASTQSTFSVKSKPAIFSLKPLTSFADMAGSYYLFTNRPYWLRLDVASSGSVSLVCQSYTFTETLLDIASSYNFCDGWISGEAKMKQLAYPYWSIDYSYRTREGSFTGVPDLEFKSNATVIFSKQAAGRLVFGTTSTKTFCGAVECLLPAEGLLDQGSLSVWQDQQAYVQQQTWPGKWLFNRDGGESTSFQLNSGGEGILSNGRILSMPEVNTISTASIYTPVVRTYTTSTPFGATATVRDSYGVSVMQRRAFSLVNEQSSYDSTALFSKTSSLLKTAYMPSDGTYGQYSVPKELQLGFIKAVQAEINVEVFDTASGLVTKSTRLIQDVDYSFTAGLVALVLRAPLPLTDDLKMPVRLRIIVKYPPVGVAMNPANWGIQIQ